MCGDRRVVAVVPLDRDTLEPCGIRSTRSSSSTPAVSARVARRTTALAVFVAVVIALAICAFFDAQLATALVTLFALVTAFIGVAWQVRDNRAHTRRELSYSYYERWSSAEMLTCRATAGELIGLRDSSEDQRWRSWHDPSVWPLERRLRALVVFSFFEELAGQYNRGALDKVAAAEYLGPQAIAMWKQSAWFIGRYRMTNANFCIEWKRMIDAVAEPLEQREAAGALAARGTTPEQAAALDFTPPPLVLPPTAGDDDWPVLIE